MKKTKINKTIFDNYLINELKVGRNEECGGERKQM
jgi:hypothetical protein